MIKLWNVTVFVLGVSPVENKLFQRPALRVNASQLISRRSMQRPDRKPHKALWRVHGPVSELSSQLRAIKSFLCRLLFALLDQLALRRLAAYAARGLGGQEKAAAAEI